MLTEKDFYDYFAEETISIGFVSTQKPEEPNFGNPELTSFNNRHINLRLLRHNYSEKKNEGDR